ncbi:hypothetical protein MA20_05775 [Bradyrhizobium japonicum]|uniref:Uncharacterized protein n=1 Tax=Bradyrhizobium japonicum TaxID=375 RepID=A0A0A3Y2I5_BRAJP|nr:hypothetical protein MA20_05775 [Bradyrhizobium japonicum]
MIVCAIKEQGQLPNMQFSSALFHQDFVKQLEGAEPQRKIQPQREVTYHGVQARFDATWIGTTEIISAVRPAVQVRANLVSIFMPREKLCRSCDAGGTVTLCSPCGSLPFRRHSSQDAYRFQTIGRIR